MVCVFVLMGNFLPLGVLIDELRCVKVASRRGRLYRAHNVDGDKLKSMLYIIGRLLRMSLLVALPDSTDVACLYVSEAHNLLWIFLVIPLTM